MSFAIALVDCTNFYVSCHELFSPKLIGRPAVALSNNDGCVIARNDAARTLKISMGVPIFQIRNLIEEHNVQLLSSCYELYGDLSSRVMDTLAEFTPELEIYSIDEAWLRFPARKGESLTALGREMQRRVRQYTGIPVSIGFARTKTLAKIARYHAKHTTRPGVNGVLDLTDSPYLAVALDRVPVADVFGVGYRYASMLEKYGIKTALALRDADDDWVRRQMTVVGLKTVHELRGIPCFPLELIPPAKKNISCSRTFGSSTESFQEVRAAVAYFTMRAAEKLRRQNLLAGSLTVFVSTDHFRRDDRQYSASTSLDVAPKSDYTPELVELAMKGLSRIFRRGFKIRRAGVLFGAFELADRVTRRLWGDDQFENQRRLMRAVDSLNVKFGRDTVRCGIYPNEGVWKSRFDKMSPRYTTRWDEICTVRAF